jgi:hypothetical protein
LDALDLSPATFRARMQEARVAGRPFFPWPEIAPEAWRASLRAIESAVAERLRRERTREARLETSKPPIELAAPAGARGLGIAAFTSGMGPLLGRWIEDGDLAAERDVGQLLLLHLDHGRRRVARLRDGLNSVLNALSAHGVAPTLVKGFHTAHALFPEAGTRPMSDVDLVVLPEEIPASSQALLEAGFTRARVLKRPYMAEWIPPGGSETPRSLDLTHDENPWSIDLHATYARDFGGVRTVSVIPKDVVPGCLDVGARQVQVLAHPYLAAYLALHASQELKNLTLVRLVELVWALRSGVDEGELLWPDLSELLERRGGLPYVYPAFELADRLAPGLLPPDFRNGLVRSTTARLRSVVDRLHPATAQRLEGVSLQEQFMWAVGPLDYVRRIRRALWPLWAGSFRQMMNVQAARARQLMKRRVTMREPN